MNDSGLVTSLLRILSTESPKTTAELSNDMRGADMKVSDSQVFDILTQEESSGRVRRVVTDQYDEMKPVTTVSWILTAPLPVYEDVIPEIRTGYADEVIIVTSQPIFLTIKGVDFRKTGIPLLSVREAMEKVIIDAKEDLRIASPYYDELFIDILNSQAHNIVKLKSIKVIAEKMDPILIKATKLFPNIKVKTIYRTTSAESKLKLEGVHAKIIIADKSEVLVGSFNFLFSHIYANVDLGLLAKGRIAEDYAKIYDLIWGL